MNALKLRFLWLECSYNMRKTMRKKNATDLLRFYGGDIREKTEDGIMTRFKRLHREKISVAFRIIYSADAEKHTKHIGKTARKGYNVKDDTPDKI